MAFTVVYRDGKRPFGVGMMIVGNESQLADAIDRLERDGYEVTNIDPPPLSLALREKALQSRE